MSTGTAEFTTSASVTVTTLVGLNLQGSQHIEWLATRVSAEIEVDYQLSLTTNR